MQKVSLKIALVAAALTLGLGGMAAAHHSGAAYDMEHPRTMEGTVKTVNWTNPHITFVVEADAKDGQPAATWVFEVSSPGVLTRSGWTKRSRRSRGVLLCPAARRQSGRLFAESDAAERPGAEFQSDTRRSMTS